MSESMFANICISWLCCLQPLVSFGLGWVISRYGVRGGYHHILDRIGVPRV